MFTQQLHLSTLFQLINCDLVFRTKPINFKLPLQHKMNVSKHCKTLTPLFQSHPTMFSIESAFPYSQFDSTTLLLHLTIPFLDTFTFGNTENWPFSRQEMRWSCMSCWLNSICRLPEKFVKQNSTALAMAYNPQSILLICFWTSGILTNNLSYCLNIPETTVSQEM